MAAVMGALMLSGTKANAQLTIAASLNPVFDGWSQSPALLKLPVAGDAIAIRLGGNGYVNDYTQPNNFFEEDMYSNFDEWPSKVNMYNYRNFNSTKVIRPGVEFRFAPNGVAQFYAGVDVEIGGSKGEYEYNYFYQTMSAPDEYTIYQINSNMSTSKSTQINPSVLIGASRQLGNGFSIFVEAAITNYMSKMTETTSENVYYSWNYGTMEFDKGPDSPEYETPEFVWNTNLELTPHVNFYVAYTFGSQEVN